MARKKKEPNRVDEILDELLEDCHSPEDILGESGLMKQIKKRLVERVLAGELSGHLKSEATAEPSVANSRNGSSKKTIQSEDGELELSIPRDRNGSFEPILVPKHQRRLAGLDEKILALYARGNSTRENSPYPDSTAR
jgi:putative transposase